MTGVDIDKVNGKIVEHGGVVNTLMPYTQKELLNQHEMGKQTISSDTINRYGFYFLYYNQLNLSF